MLFAVFGGDAIAVSLRVLGVIYVCHSTGIRPIYGRVPALLSLVDWTDSGRLVLPLSFFYVAHQERREFFCFLG